SITAEQGDYLRNIMVQIEHEIYENKETHLLRALLYQALAWINNTYLSQSPLKEETHISKSIQFRQLVDQHFRQEHSVAFYAGQLCITPGHLNDLVRKEPGTTAKQFIINRLTTEAKRLLLYSELPVSEIAWELGIPILLILYACSATKPDVRH
ncbi:MAG TPA: AraC family transcriptional regulator, partial [Prolixibacteraceae bacterium]|nr:AraC family transcriptional regulator [Prolixibacteraceae bacterium]